MRGMRVFVLLILVFLCIEFVSSESTTSFVSTNFLLNLSEDGGKLVELGWRNESTDSWTYYNISMWGRFKNVTGSYDTLDFVPTIYNFTIGNHTIVKYEIDQGNVFWNFWFDLDNNSKQLEASRFVHVPAGITLTGIGVVFNETDSYTDELNLSYVYSDVGGSYTGGYFNYDDGYSALRVSFGNLLNSSYSNTSSQQIFWYRNFSQLWNYSIDYKRFTFVPYLFGNDVSEHDGYMKQHVFDHDLTNVELAGSWILRSHNKEGEIRDWFNENDYANSFNNAIDTDAGYWRDAWTTGTLIGGLMDTYNVTEDIFYLMRMVDIIDYQVNRTSYTFRDPYSVNWGGFADHPMGRIKYSLETYDLTGIDYYKNVAVNSTNWFFNTQNFAADGSHQYHNITDFAYSFEGLFRAANLSGNETNMNKTRDWMIFIDNDAWRETEQLYKEIRNERFWSRGNGWWLESFLGTMGYYHNKSAIDTNRTLLEINFRKAIYSLPSYQDSSGAWRQLINDSSSYLESSGTTMIAASMAEGFSDDYLNATALETAIKAICSIHSNEFFKIDGTINSTDRGAASEDPFPYTQQGYVKFARNLNIEEVVMLSNRSTLYTTFDEGVLVCDNGTITDSNGYSVGANDKVVIKDYVNGTSSVKNITLLGVDNNLTLTWEGFNVSADYNVTTWNSTSVQDSQNVSSNSSGVLIFNVTLSGEHVIEVVNITIESDTTPPNVSFVSPLNQSYSSQELLINITNSSDASSIWWFNGTDNLTYTAAINYNFTEGSNTIIAYVNDSENNVNATNLTFSIDLSYPVITLVSPDNNTVSSGNGLFRFNVSDDEVANCSLIINSSINETNSSVVISLTQNMNVSLPAGENYWSVNCTDSVGNRNASEERVVTVIRSDEFSINTTNFTAIHPSNLSNVSLVLENSFGKLNYTQVVNLSGGADLDRYANISTRRIEINSTGFDRLNISSLLYFYGVTYTNPGILRDGASCSALICQEVSYLSNIFVVNVSEFSTYTVYESYVAPPVVPPPGGGGSSGGVTPVVDNVTNESVNSGVGDGNSGSGSDLGGIEELEDPLDNESGEELSDSSSLAKKIYFSSFVIFALFVIAVWIFLWRKHRKKSASLGEYVVKKVSGV